jgi:predicted DNA binding CopG/RHH family protein
MKYKFDQEEKEILDAFERDELKSVPNVVQEIKDARLAARNTFNKIKRVNLRLTERDFHMAHIKALEEGLPYQTLLSSVIHKYLTGRLIDKT